jgi:hypothetical protein
MASDIRLGITGEDSVAVERLSRRRVISTLSVAFVIAIVPAVFFAWVSVHDLREEINQGRLREAELLAAQADNLLSNATFELELVAARVASPISAGNVVAQPEISLGGTVTAASLGILILDPDGDVLAAEPSTVADDWEEAAGKNTSPGAATEVTSVSPPFRFSPSNRVVTALSVPVYADDGTRVAVVVGLVDLTGPLMAGLVEPALRIGATGHADLVDERGTVLVSTNPAHVLEAGDHPTFYEQAATGRVGTVGRVTHSPGADDLDRSSTHLMAWAPLRNAPWAVALGSSEREAMDAVYRMQNRLIAAGLASALTLAIAVGVVARMLGRRDRLMSETQ